MELTLKDLEEALIEGWITLEEFVQVLVDNLGLKITKKIIKHNLKIAARKSRKGT